MARCVGAGVSQMLGIAETSYFSVQVDDANAASLNITLTALTGNPNLYVTLLPLNRSMLPSDAQWKSEQYGSDFVTISKPEPLKTYSILVLASSNLPTFFTLSASWGASLVELSDGHPVDGSIPQSTTKSYSFRIGRKIAQPNFNPDLIVTLSARFGDVSMFLSNDASKPIIPSNNATYQYSTLGNARLRGTLIVPAANVETKTYRLLVQANSNANYTLSYSYAMPSVLAFGKPFTAHVNGGEYRYFTFTTDNTDPVQIVISSLSENPDVYYRKDGNLPNTTYFEDRSLGQPTQPYNLLVIPHGQPGVEYVVAVYGQPERPSLFSISVTSSFLYLAMGVSQTVSSAQQSLFFFDVDISTAKPDVFIQISAASSDVYQLYVINTYTTPTVANAVWSTRTTGASTFIIPGNDPKYCPASDYCGAFYVAVVPVTVTSQYFTITTATASSMTLLGPNSDLPSSVVTVGSYRMFQLPVASADNFTLVLETCSGNADMFGSNNYVQNVEPSKDRFTLESTRSRELDYFKYSGGSTGSALYVAVYGQKATETNLVWFKIHSRIGSLYART